MAEPEHGSEIIVHNNPTYLPDYDLAMSDRFDGSFEAVDHVIRAACLP